MRGIFRLAAAAGIGVLLSACGATPYMVLEEVTEEALSEIAFPAPTHDLSLLRSRYIAASVALYGGWAVKEHSGERLQSDAAGIYAHFKDTMNRLDTRWADRGKGEDHFEYALYVDEVFELADAAARPARRRYREAILGFITGDHVGGAKTAFSAIKNILKIERYRGAIALTARDHATEILCGGKDKIASCFIATDQAAWNDFRCWACPTIQGCPAPPSKGLGPDGAGDDTARGRITKSFRENICLWPKEDIRSVDRAWIVAVANKKVPGRAVDVTDWKRVDKMLLRACTALAAYAGKVGEITTVCDARFKPVKEAMAKS